MAKRFENKTALVTGGSRGIGKAIAQRLVQEGANVYVIGKSQENLDKLKAETPTLNIIQADVSDWDKTRFVVEEIGSVDLLVNNAGILNGESVLDLDQELFDKTINTNFKSAFNITQIVTRDLMKNGRTGAVVNMSSVIGLKGIKNNASYSMSKAMMDMLTKVTALELGPYNIRVNSVNPSGTYTDMTKHILDNKEMLPIILARHPIGRLATVEDVVEATLFLLSDESAMITGNCLAVDGGWLIS